MTSFVRHRIATVIGLLALNGMAFAQEPVEEVLFDEAPPAIADNLPPDPATAAAELSESDSVGILQPLPPEEVPVRQPTIRKEMRPFNSRRIDLVEALVQEPKQVTFNGKVYDLKNPDRVRVFYENEQYPTIWTQENKLLDNFEQLKRLIADAPQDALPPARYHDALINSLKAGEQYDDIIAAELLLSDAYLSLAGDLANGLVNPRKTQPEWNAEKVSDEALGEMLAQGIVSGDIETAVRTINNGNPRYLALKSQYNALNGAPVAAEPADAPCNVIFFTFCRSALATANCAVPATDMSAPAMAPPMGPSSLKAFITDTAVLTIICEACMAKFTSAYFFCIFSFSLAFCFSSFSTWSALPCAASISASYFASILAISAS